MTSIPERRERRLATQARYRAKHAERLRAEHRERMRASYAASPEKHREWARRWREAHREERREAQRRYAAANPEKVRETVRRYAAAHRVENRERKRRYREANPGSTAIYEACRRARKRAAGGSFSRAEWNALKARYDYRCLRCGKQEPEIKLTMDHVIPLSKGGRHVADNIQPLCLSCNCSKQTNHYDYRHSQLPSSS